MTTQRHLRNAAWTLSALLGGGAANADALFAPLPSNIATYAPRESAVAVDLDADGRTDWVVGTSNGSSARVLWLRQTADAAVWSSTVLASYAEGEEGAPVIAVIDADRDGLLDVVAGRRPMPDVPSRIHLLRRPLGGTTWSDTVIDTNNALWDIAPMRHGADPGVLLAYYDSDLELLTFPQAGSSASTRTPLSFQAHDIDVADLDHDGDDDVAIRHYSSIRLMRQTAPLAFTAINVAGSAASRSVRFVPLAAPGARMNLGIAFMRPQARMARFACPAACTVSIEALSEQWFYADGGADFDGDGDYDLFGRADEGNGYSNRTAWIENRGSGGWRQRTLDTPLASVTALIEPGGGSAPDLFAMPHGQGQGRRLRVIDTRFDDGFEGVP